MELTKSLNRMYFQSAFVGSPSLPFIKASRGRYISASLYVCATVQALLRNKPGLSIDKSEVQKLAREWGVHERIYNINAALAQSVRGIANNIYAVIKTNKIKKKTVKVFATSQPLPIIILSIGGYHFTFDRASSTGKNNYKAFGAGMLLLSNQDDKLYSVSTVFNAVERVRLCSLVEYIDNPVYYVLDNYPEDSEDYIFATTIRRACQCNC